MDNDIEVVLLKISGDREKRGYLMRTSVREETEALTDDMQRAKRQIERAYKIIAGMMYAGASSVHKIPGISESDAEWQQEQINKLDEWAKSLPKLKDGRNIYNICLDVCAFGMTYKESANQRFCAPSTIMRKLRLGLNEWCIMQGG